MFPLQKYLKYSLLFMGLLILTACGGESSSSDPATEIIDSDGDGVADTEDDFKSDPTETTDTDGDGVGDNSDPDIDGDDVLNEDDADIDGDGVTNDEDAFPEDATETTDTDNDGVGDNADTDIDGDGVLNEDDADIDGDGVSNEEDAFPEDATETTDTDDDGVGDNADADIDGDGVSNEEDAFPEDATETTDTDDDGVGDNADADIDGDGVSNEDDADIDGDGVTNDEDAFPEDSTETTDTDDDGVGDNSDTDIDGDGVLNEDDAFPEDATETADTDSDGIGDNSDADIDGDGVTNEEDAFPEDATETTDTDNDGIGDHSDTDIDGDDVLNEDDADIDGDGVSNEEDAFPEDSTETTDTDGDGVGDNSDPDIDGDNVLNEDDAFPEDATETTDTDNDGIGDNSDPDIDGDGVPNEDDDFETDPTETTDTDGDGTGDNADIDADNDGLIELYTLEHLDWVRNDLAGTSLTDHENTSDTTGCPAILGCNGYELAADLDFDTNDDGVMDTNDTYYDYDDGENNGWLPIGTVAFPFSANFDGNDHSISNLYINRSTDDAETTGENIGLFGVVSAEADQSISLSNIQLDGALMEVGGDGHTGGLIGYIYNTSDGSTLTISNNTTAGDVAGDVTGDVTGDVLADNYSNGGLIGYIRIEAAVTLTISNNRASGDVVSNIISGGLIGVVENFDDAATLTLSNNVATGDVSTFTSTAGGLIGYISDAGTLTVSNNVATGDVSGTEFSIGGLVGRTYSEGTSSVVFSNNLITGDISGATGSIGGMFGSTGNEGTMTLSNNLVSSAVIPDPTNDGSQVGAYNGWYFSGNAPIYSNNYYNSSEEGVSGLSAVGRLVPAGLLDPLEAPTDSREQYVTQVASATLEELQCPVRAHELSCAISYAGWDTAVWDFGTRDELPGLIIDGVIYRDADGDGALDEDDAFPMDPTETTDSDGDRVGDNADDLPFDSDETTDTDGDGTGDNADAFDDDPTEQTDSDGDGVGDNADAFDDDATETTDTDNDGIGDNADIDADDDGLIELYTLEQLDWVRNDLAGTSLTDHENNIDATGCYPQGCNGYELMANLDFDTNGDGVMDEDDDYYDYDGDSSNNGWLPIGTVHAPFSANFDGNDHSISNLYINRTSDDTNATAGLYIGLFGVVSAETDQNMTLSNILLDGALMSVRGDRTVGGLIGYIDNYIAGADPGDLTISNNRASGDVTGNVYTGGLIGQLHLDNASTTATLDNNRVTGEVQNDGGWAGGLVGLLSTDSNLILSNNVVTGDVSTDGPSTGGLVGYYLNSELEVNLTVSNNLVAGDVSGATVDSNSATGGLFGWFDWLPGVDDREVEGTYGTGTISNNMVTGDIAVTDATDVSDNRNFPSGLFGSIRIGAAGASDSPTCFTDVNDSDGDGIGDNNTTDCSNMTFSANLVSSALVVINETGGSFGGAFVGAVGFGKSKTHVYNASYYNSDEAGATRSVGEEGIYTSRSEDDGFILSELQCPTSADNSVCAASTLYEDWDDSAWDFGTADELPGLIIDGSVYRDAEGDGNLSITEITE